ncbi:nicotinate-nucleotide--dimethylbenzimidazole phosphoribosyltransferase [Streptomyces nitrosporeus]|uniref:nicotinate-nucleotide--dimethylbenzimidazole phosphoribosyltransferase n=1 Tax=Streptomyces nitrosporeus TaxID=28894 RepID=UPI003321ABA1
MTDTGQIPGEGLPEHAGMVEQPGVPAPDAYTFLDPSEHAPEDDDLLLMPAPQGAWSDGPAEQVPAQGQAAGGAYGTGAAGLDGTRIPAPAAQAPAQVPAHAAAAPAPARRPLSRGPVEAPSYGGNATGGVVRSLADRGPAGAPQSPAAGRHAGPPTTGPEYLDTPEVLAEAPAPVPQARPESLPPQGAAPWTTQEPGAAVAQESVPQPEPVPQPAQAPVPAPVPGPEQVDIAETVVPEPAADAAVSGVSEAETPVSAAPDTVPVAPAAEQPAPQASAPDPADGGGTPAETAAPADGTLTGVPAQETGTMGGQFVAVEGSVPSGGDLAPTPAQPEAVQTEAVHPEAVRAEAQQPSRAVEAPAAVPGRQATVPAPRAAEPAPFVEAAAAHAAAAQAAEAHAAAVQAAGAQAAEAQAQAEPEQPAGERQPEPSQAPAQEAPAAEAQQPGTPATRPEPAADPQAPQDAQAPEDSQVPQDAQAPQAPQPAQAPAAEAAVPVPAPVPAEQPAADPGTTAPDATAPAPEEAGPAGAAPEEAEAATGAAPAEEQAEAPAADDTSAPEAGAGTAPEAPAEGLPANAPEPGTADAPEAPAAEEAPAAGETPAAGEAPTPEEAPAGLPDDEAATTEDVPFTPPAPGYDDAEREAVLRVMRERRDIRNGFRSDPIPHEVLLRVLEAAHTAPSVGHSQPWDFVVIRSAETRRAMHELAQRQRDAYAKSLPKARAKQFKELKIEAILDTPVNIVVTADPTRGGRHTLGRHTQPQMAPYSSALAVENLWLAARAEGLGVGWVSFFDEREMVRALGLPEHLEVVAYLCVGYVDEFPDEPELMQAGWSKRRPLSWVVHEETYGRRALPGEAPHDLLQETISNIRPLDAKALGEAWERQKRMTKPAGALGMLEIISAQLSGLSRICPPPVPEPAAVAVFAGDHGVHAQGVTAWPQEVTGQMVANFLSGGAVCNAFAAQVGAEVCVVDVGVATDLPASPGLLPRKVRPGTADFTTGPAMTREEVLAAIEVGIETARDLVSAGNKALLTGEMGIANTTASAALICVYTGMDPAEVTGRGTGINDEMHARKVDVVRRALDLHRPDATDPIGVLAAVGGLEHAAMAGFLLGGASLRTPVILDGVSAGAAALVARAIAPEALAACIAGHRSAEPGHVAALNKLGLRPLVDLDLRLGEGTGALLALPIVQSAARAMHEVATFDSAGVTEK